MHLVARPVPSVTELSAIRLALARARVEVEELPAAYSSAWARAAVREAVEAPVRPSYAPSPRNTRGATRA